MGDTRDVSIEELADRLIKEIQKIDFEPSYRSQAYRKTRRRSWRGL
jgi:hypothetical protein